MLEMSRNIGFELAVAAGRRRVGSRDQVVMKVAVFSTKAYDREFLDRGE